MHVLLHFRELAEDLDLSKDDSQMSGVAVNEVYNFESYFIFSLQVHSFEDLTEGAVADLLDNHIVLKAVCLLQATCHFILEVGLSTHILIKLFIL